MMQSVSKPLTRGSSVLFGLALAVAWSVAGLSSAYAQSAGCGCLVAAGTAGLVQSASGNVFVSQANGSVPAQSNMLLQAGNSVIVGPQSTSTVSFGKNCTLHLRANTIVQVRPQGGQLCLAINNQAVDGTTTAATESRGGFVTPETIFGGIVAGTAIIAIADDSKSVSK